MPSLRIVTINLCAGRAGYVFYLEMVISSLDKEKDMSKDQFTSEVLANERSMYYIAKSILNNDEDCADAIQNAILGAYSNLKTLKNEKYFKTWLTRILINECYAIIRKNKRVVSYEAYMDNDMLDVSTEYSEVYLEIQALEEKYRLPFVLHYVEGFSLKEISSMLKISEASVKMRLMRGRNILKKQLGHS